MVDPMLLLFAIKGLVVPGGGAERVFVDIVNGLKARGHEVRIATFDEPGQHFFYEIDPEIPRYLMGAGRPGEPTPRARLIQVARSVRALAKTMQPDATVAFMHSTYVPVAFGLAGTGIPLIASEHTSAAHFAPRPVQRTLARWAQRMAFATTVVSQQIYDEHPLSSRANLQVLPNPVDLAAFANARTQTPSSNVILCVGGLRPEKDQLTLISAFDIVAQDFPDWRLRLVGDGRERPAIEARISASPFRSRIDLPGVLQDVATEYANASIVALPSRYESFGMVAIEAMASGRPVIGFNDCAGSVTLIQHGLNGLLADTLPNRAKGLAAALRMLMAAPEWRIEMGARAPATVEQYSIDAIVRHWENLLLAAAAIRSRSKNVAAQPAEPTCEPRPHHD
jgi:glycosyltransferase involved in cell wall biosynthesis